MSTPTGPRARGPARYVFLRTPVPFQRKVLRKLGRRPPWVSGRPPPAPPVPAGMRTGPPDFVGIGAAKSGTTWWFSLLMSHPEIHVEHDKELNYFNEPFLKRVDNGSCTLADAESYQGWFPRPEGTITGEWTPHYALAFRLPPVLRAAAPGAKLLVMLRDPIERYRSDLSRPMPGTARQRLRYRSLPNSMYANLLQPWEEVYAPDEILVLQFEACVRSPDEHLAETFLVALMQPRVLRLRRLVISSADRFPEISSAWYEKGFERVLAALASSFRALADRQLLVVDDATAAAEHFVGMLFWIPVNKAMFTGDDDYAATHDLVPVARTAAAAFMNAYGAG